jgi:hypothetical protein
MYDKLSQFSACAGADSLSIMLVAGYGERNGIAVSSGQRGNTGLSGVPAFCASANWRADEGTTVSTFAAVQIPTTVVRERLPLADAHALGSLARGAPV